jgi:hypothetical protein
VKTVSVLVIAFNRPDLLKKCLQQIPKDGRAVYIAIDGPRDSVEKAIVEKSLEVANEFVYKNPEVSIRVNYSKTNKGCKEGVRSAIDWVFKFENSAIILEDDISASPSFFQFADWGIATFAEKNEVWQLNGFTPLLEPYCVEGLYWSKYAHIWGWATWKDRWDKYDRNLDHFPEKSVQNLATFKDKNLSEAFIREFNSLFDRCKNGFDTWDAQWLYSMWLHNGIAATPGSRLTGNRGFDKRATHTTRAGNLGRDALPDSKSQNIQFEFKNPAQSEILDLIHEIIEFGINPAGFNIRFTKRYRMRIYQILNSNLIDFYISALKVFQKKKLSKR